MEKQTSTELRATASSDTLTHAKRRAGATDIGITSVKSGGYQTKTAGREERQYEM